MLAQPSFSKTRARITLQNSKLRLKKAWEVHFGQNAEAKIDREERIWLFQTPRMEIKKTNQNVSLSNL